MGGISWPLIFCVKGSLWLRLTLLKFMAELESLRLREEGLGVFQCFLYNYDVMMIPKGNLVHSVLCRDDFVTCNPQRLTLPPLSSANTIFVLYLPLGMDLIFMECNSSIFGYRYIRRLGNYTCEHIFL